MSKAGWYRFTIHHGPGHQSKTVEFLYLSAADSVKSNADMFGERFGGDFGNAPVRARHVTKLPEYAYASIMREAERSIVQGNATIRRLKGVKTFKERRSPLGKFNADNHKDIAAYFEVDKANRGLFASGHLPSLHDLSIAVGRELKRNKNLSTNQLFKALLSTYHQLKKDHVVIARRYQKRKDEFRAKCEKRLQRNRRA